jgi:hypothetical protein
MHADVRIDDSAVMMADEFLTGTAAQQAPIARRQRRAIGPSTLRP